MTSDILYDRRMLRTIKALEGEFEIEVITQNLHREQPEERSFEITKINSLFKHGLLFYAEYNLRIFVLLLVKSFDIICSVDFDTLPACSLAKRFKGKKLVFDAHEYFEESVEITDRRRVKSFWTWIGKVFVPTCNAAYTVSASIAEIYSKLHGLHFGVIRNLPNYEEFENWTSNHNAKIILYQGMLNEGRKLRDLVNASTLLPHDFQIWIIGEGDISSELKEMEAGEVRFFSWVSPEELSPLTRQASLGFNLLDSKSQSYYYSLANKFFDYMHAGVPSINNNFPEYARINERYNCCFLYDSQDSEQLADFIEDSINKSAEWQEKAKNSRLAARDLCWDKEEKKLLHLFQCL